ncbi:MAG TPA: O-antigen ligase family protein [Bryobacteraceae bacterium]|nr:O-antigen ligase family protein [Bryobacteraceae bacterium]
MSSRARRTASRAAREIAASPAPEPLRISAWIGISSIAVTPLGLVTGVFISHDVIPKLVLLALGAALLLVFYPQWNPGLQALLRRRDARIFLILVAAQIVSLAVSTVLSSQMPLSIAGTVWRRFGLIGQISGLVVAVAVASVVASRPVWLTALLRSVTLCGGLASVYGILQYFRIDPFLDPRLYSIDYFGGISRPPATMGHALYFSAYLVPVLFMAAAAAFADPNRTWRLVHAATVVLTGTAILFSATRSAVLAVIAGAAWFAWSALRGRGRLSIRYFAAPIVVVLGVAAFILSPAGANLRHRIDQWPSDLGGPRLGMWKECPGLIAQHPIFGEGPDVFAGEFRKVQSAELSRAFPDFYNETPHNALLDAACAQGLPGAILFIALFAIAWRAGWHADFRQNPIRTGLNAALLGMLVSSMFASLTLVSSLYLWAAAGLAVALSPAETSVESPRQWRIPGLALAVPALALVLPAVLLMRQDALWADFEHAVEANEFTAAKEAYSSAISAAFGLPGYELWASREWATLGRSIANSRDAAATWKLAADAASRAEANGEERFSAAYQSSVLQVALGNLAGAEAQAREAIELAPNWYKAHLLCSQVLVFSGKNEESAREAALAASLGWRKQ